MTISGILLFILILVLIFWLLGKLSLDAPTLNMIRTIVVVLAIVILLNNLGVFDGGPVLRLR